MTTGLRRLRSVRQVLPAGRAQTPLVRIGGAARVPGRGVSHGGVAAGQNAREGAREVRE